MSSICIGFAHGLKESYPIFEDLQKIAAEFNCWICNTVDWEEPFLSSDEQRCRSGVVFTFSDGPLTANCEMLLLPDGWTLNSYINPVPFEKRMEVFTAVTSHLLESCGEVDLLLGVSGLDLSDYTAISVTPEEIPRVMQTQYCGEYECTPLILRVRK